MVSVSRRNFLKYASLGGLAAACGTTLHTGLDTFDIKFERVDINIPDLPPSFAGYRIGFISDTHVGSCSTAGITEQAVSMLAAEKPDLLCLGGDYIVMPDYLIDQGLMSLRSGRDCFRRGNSFEEDLALADTIYAGIADILSGFRPADGVFGVYGNHDKWVSPELCRKHLQSRGIRLLNNETVSIERSGERLHIHGVDDYWSGVPRLPAGIERKHGKASWIVLSHNPDYISWTLENSGFPLDLALCGHTHGGQIRLPVLGAIHYNIRHKEFAIGLASSGKTSVYTSRGIGVVGLPIRLNCPPEVSILTLKRA